MNSESRQTAPSRIEASWLSGGGEMAERIRAFDWSSSPLGPLESWPQSLKTSVNLILNSQHPMWIGWGPKASFLYNDAYVRVLGELKHPRALGQPAAEVWAEIWDVCGPLADKVFQKGEPTFADDVRLFMNRGGFLEETYYAFSYSPIRDESGGVAGLFCPSADVTAKNLNARRTRTLSELAAHVLLEKSVKAACATSARILRRNPDDIPFALLYLCDQNEGLELKQAVAIPSGSILSPRTVELGGPSVTRFADSINKALRSARPQILNFSHDDPLPLGAAGQPVTQALVLPMNSRGKVRLGVIVAGVNPTRKLDSEYRVFLSLVANHVATAIANAKACEADRQQAEALAALDRAKTNFFSNVSHEFRTPLTLMLAPVEDLLSRGGANLTLAAKEQLEIVNRNGSRLLRLVNTLLDFTRIEAGRVQASYEATELAAFTAELASVFRAATERAGLRLRVECPPLPQSAYVDREMWEKIVLNLISNAFKFTFAGEIAVSLQAVGAHVELCVRDTGVGIPADEMPRLFERFHRIENTRSRTHEGSGIGLALVQELVKLHGGSVRASSVFGAGTSFTVAIPFGSAHLPPDRVGLPRHRDSTATGAAPFVEEALRWLPGEATSYDDLLAPPARLPFPPVASQPGEPGALHPLRPFVIVADDNSDMRHYLARLLAERYEVRTVVDGEAALSAARERPPDLILSDVMMPRLDGFGLVKKIRADEKYHTIPVILLSARAGEESRLEGLGVGADDYLVKPFSARELLARVESHLKLSRVRKEAEQRVTSILESITDGFLTVAPDWQITFLNSAAQQMLSAQGLNPAALLGQSFWESLPLTAGLPAGLAYRENMIQRQAGAFEHFSEPWQTWYSIRFFPIREGGLSVFFQDITERKKAQSEMARTTSILQAINENSADAIYVKDTQSRLLSVNPKTAKIIGKPAAEVLGKNEIEWGGDTPEHRVILENDRRVLASRSTLVLEESFIGRDGIPRIFHSSKVCWLGNDGKPLGLIGISRDITDRKLAENAVRMARESAEKANQTKDHFLAALSHELRTPLTPVSVLLAGLCEHPALPPGVLTDLEIIKRNVELETRLIDDLLDLTRVAQGKLILHLSSVKLGHLIEDAVKTCEAELTAQRLSLIRNLANPEQVLHVDGARVTQILWNLLKNAIKFSPPGGAISLLTRGQTEGSAEQVIIEVQDSGRGIEPENLQRIFNAFDQGNRQITRQFGGLGLGLAISKAIAEAHHGKLVAASRGIGYGSTFTVTLPCTMAATVALNQPPLAGEGRHLPAAPAPRQPATLRILLVEDHLDTANSLRVLLMRRGYSVAVARDVGNALQLAAAQHFDLLLSDLGLPDATGFELMQQIRKQYSMPGIALSGYGMENDIRKCHEAGFSGHLVKPILISQLEETIARVRRTGSE